jgi:prepilin-type N-terminal cleavage/methylation domain-containing protein
MSKNQFGFTLIEVLIAAGIMGLLAVGAMQLIKNMNDGQTFQTSSSDEQDLKSEIRMILEDERFCRVSLAGNGPLGHPINPVLFRKANNDQDHEGLEVELWLSDQKGEKRTLKKFSAKDAKLNIFGKLQIESMKLIFNNDVPRDYLEMPAHGDVAELRINYQKKISSTQSRSAQLKFPIKVGLKTDSGRWTTILTCSR